MNNGSNEFLPSISVVVNVFNGETTLRKCLECILNSDYPAERMELLVIDDGSTDSTPRILEDLQAKSRTPFQVVRQKNMGFAEAKNKGFSLAKGEIIFTFSADVYVSKDYIRLVTEAFSDEKVGIAQGPLLVADSVLKYPLYHVNSQPTPSFHYICAAIAYRTKAMDEVGRFLDKRLSYCGDDTDFALRILEAGYEYRWVCAAKAYHDFVPEKISTLPKSLWNQGPQKLVLLLKLHPQLSQDLLVKRVFWPGWFKGRIAAMSIFLIAPILFYLLGVAVTVFFIVTWYLGLMLYVWAASYRGFEHSKKILAYLPLITLFRLVRFQLSFLQFLFYSIKYKTLVL